RSTRRWGEAGNARTSGSRRTASTPRTTAVSRAVPLAGAPSGPPVDLEVFDDRRAELRSSRPQQTMPTPHEDRLKAARAYDAAADAYDHPANSFWDRFGARTVERLALSSGARVLDICCGSGASALPAAQAVGPRGSVIGVDVTENLLALARAKASR